MTEVIDIAHAVKYTIKQTLSESVSIAETLLDNELDTTREATATATATAASKKKDNWHRRGRGSKRYDLGWRYCSPCLLWIPPGVIKCARCKRKTRVRSHGTISKSRADKVVRY